MTYCRCPHFSFPFLKELNGSLYIRAIHGFVRCKNLYHNMDNKFPSAISCKYFHKNARNCRKSTVQVKIQSKNKHLQNCNGDFNLNFIKDLENENPSKSSEAHSRFSDLNIQMISECLHKQLFRTDSSFSGTSASKDELAKSILHLQQHGLWGRKSSVSPDVSFNLPPISENSLEKHIYLLGENQCGPYKNIVNALISCNLPKIPEHFQYTKGWTKYYLDGKTEKVKYPSCSSLVFDIEVCMSEGTHPTLACAASQDHWYSWCSDSLIDDTKNNTIRLEDLIPLESSDDSHRVIIGHNVSFDRLAVREQYFLDHSKVRYLDTMSLHIAVGGLVEQQRNLLAKNTKAETKIRLPWMNVGCPNSLKDVSKFYCKKDLVKESRNIFIKGSIHDVRHHFQKLMKYCAQDVEATHSVLVKLFPLFLDRFPHPVTLAGMFEMGTAYLPVCNNWKKYTNLSENKFEELNAKLTSLLVEQTQKSLILEDNEAYRSDLWLWDLDWSRPKGKVKQFQNYPNWYRKLCMRSRVCDAEIPQDMSTSLRIVPKMLKLTWNGYPLHYENDLGWGYLKPASSPIKDSASFPMESLLKLTESIKDTSNGSSDELPSVNIGIPNVKFFPLPHKNGMDYKVGNPLSKDFLGKLEDNTLSSAVSDVAQLVLKITKIISYWKNNRSRILSQTVVKLGPGSLPSVVTNADDYDSEDEYGAILPQVITAGTVTRRAVEKTWMTASNAYSDRIGSELKAMIKAPPGYSFVGADVDSQELWIASVLGDSFHAGQHGCTALGWMTLQGSKAEGTDMHSITAKAAGISRDNAKVINYGRIYGAGLKFIERLLKQFNPSLSNQETKKRAAKLYAATKGEKGRYLNTEGKNLAEIIGFEYKGGPLTNKEINLLLKLGNQRGHYFSKEEIVQEKYYWVGGSESHMFNCLEAIACSNAPRTPALGCRITRALEPWCVFEQYMTSRVNWVVQSSAVDFLHLMLVCMRWLFTEYKIRGRFSISIHDEVRYLVVSEDRYRAALALQITNLLTRSFISKRLGLDDLPMSVAFFSGVDIDKVLRKEPDQDCVTPSNPEGLEKEYSVPKGETLNIYQILEKTKGNLSPVEN